jgi:murein L,D-transpeptidase YcbB/YkuD
LRARLDLPAGTDDLFDGELDAAVRAFQQSQGLAIDGIVGRNTLDLLNITDAARITRIDVNLERWRWLMRALPATRVQVNVADYTLQAFDAGREALRMNVFSPDWRVPRRIAVEDKLPLLQKDAAALAAQGYEARPANSPDPFQPVDALDWSTVTRSTFNYLLRQRPGENNALGRIKFILPNPHAVYLHDTPARELFARSGRAFSSGCIRLEHARLLADWVLRDQPAWTRERIDAVLEAGETVEVPLRQPLPVLVLYFTVVAGESGTVYFRPDLYGRDAKVAAALSGSTGAAAGPGAR